MKKINISDRVLDIDLVYKYNPHKPLNGSLFYAFEYLIKLCEHSFNCSDGKRKDELPRLFILCPKNIKLKEKLFNVFIRKYPINNQYFCSYKDNITYNNLADTILGEEEAKEYYKIKKIVSKAFSQISFIRGPELLKYKTPKLFISYNTWYSCYKLKYINPKDKISNLVFQNRANKQIDYKDIIPLLDNTIFLYETEHQKLISSEMQNHKIKQIKYKLKIGFKYFYNKKLIRQTLYGKSDVLISGIIPEKLNNKNRVKPTKFFETSRNRYFFEGTKEIWYYRNLYVFDENNRIIPEARYYGFKIKIIDVSDLYPDYLKNWKYSFDTSITRLKDPLIKYNLDKDVKIIKLIEGL